MTLYRYEFDADMLGDESDLREFAKHLQREFDAANLPLVACAVTDSTNGARVLHQDAQCLMLDIDQAWERAKDTFADDDGEPPEVSRIPPAARSSYMRRNERGE